MTKTELTLDNVIDFLERAVQERGEDFVYRKNGDFDTACQYVKDGAPSCLVGVVLAMAGASVEELQAMDNSAEPGIGLHWLSEDDPDFYQAPFPVEITEQAMDVLGVAQVSQDTGHTWGTALRNARSQANVYKAVSSGAV